MNNGCEFGVCVCLGGGMGQTIQQLNQIADI